MRAVAESVRGCVTTLTEFDPHQLLAESRLGVLATLLSRPILTGFLCFAMVIVVVTWKDWWLDARIALACHFMDVTFFVTVVGAPQGYSSPYFLYFVFLLLSPAIRWTWRETAVTAAIVIGLYVVAGLLFGLASDVPFDSRRFIIRSGYLMILSIVLIWFGVRRRFSTGSIGEPMAAAAVPNDTPLGAALRRGFAATGATEGLAYWSHRDGTVEAVALNRDDLRPAPALELPSSRPAQAFLFDSKLDRALVSALERLTLDQAPPAGVRFPQRVTLRGRRGL